MSPPDSVITIEDMESEDLRPAEHPATPDATAAGSRSVGQLNDIGSVIKLGMSADEAARAVNVLSNGEKYKLLTNHFQPSANFPFPKVFSNGCNRQFQHKCLSSHWRLKVLPWPANMMSWKRLFRMPENTSALAKKVTRRSGTSCIQLQMQASSLTYFAFVSCSKLLPRKEYRPREQGESSRVSAEIVEAPESDSSDTVTLEDWDDWFGPSTTTTTVVEPDSDADSDS